MGFQVAPPNLKTIKAIVLQTNEKIVLSKFYDSHLQNNTKHLSDIKNKLKQQQFQGESAEALIVDNTLIVYQKVSNFFGYLLADSCENEILLGQLLSSIIDTIMRFIPPPYDNETFLNFYDILLIILDEFIDSGVILEIEPTNVINNCESYFSERSVNDSILLKALQITKEQLIH